MFAYIERNSFLHKRNPMMKFAIIIVWTFVVSMSYFPVLPILVFLIAFLGTWIGGEIPLRNLLKRLTVFISVSVIFMISMLFLRGIGEEPGIVFRFCFLQWTEQDIVHAVSLGFRILAFVTLSMSFVLTTRPRDLVLSIILQCKIPALHGYAVMATYRFLPELQSQVDMVHLAQEIRGIPWNKGVASRFTSPFRVMLPLFCVAARRGERVACAMESRGLGRAEERTFYHNIKIEKTDWLFFAVMTVGLAILVAILVKLDLYHFNFAVIG